MIGRQSPVPEQARRLRRRTLVHCPVQDVVLQTKGAMCHASRCVKYTRPRLGYTPCARHRTLDFDVTRDSTRTPLPLRQHLTSIAASARTSQARKQVRGMFGREGTTEGASVIQILVLTAVVTEIVSILRFPAPKLTFCLLRVVRS